jgi:hypothetical protein
MMKSEVEATETCGARHAYMVANGVLAECGA